MNKENVFIIGFGSVDITPPFGLAMSGGLDPRWNEGIHTPLKAKTLYAESDGNRLAIIGVDLLGLPREFNDEIISSVCDQTDLDASSVLICCSHTHSGPYIRHRTHFKEKVVDEAYVDSLPGSITQSVVEAIKAKQPATMHIGRSLVFDVLHNRRVTIKSDGRAFNTWMRDHLNDLSAVPQVLGTAGPIDPELWVARFDAVEGSCIGTLVNFSMHSASKGGVLWSADYPAMIAERMASEFGSPVVSVFTAGACGNINPRFENLGWDKGAEIIATEAVHAARRAMPIETPIRVSTSRQNLSVKRRDVNSQRKGAIERLNWNGLGGRNDVFEARVAEVGAMPERLMVPVSAACIGPLGIATNPGELFVEWGIDIKRRSTFPYTIVTELTNDTIGYEPNKNAFELEGYETLVGANTLSLEGIVSVVDSAVAQLEQVHNKA
jgi:neutral ceramidase